jgi:hypothetical protein
VLTLVLQLPDQVLEPVGDRLPEKLIVHGPQVISDAGLDGAIKGRFAR